jgi:hypothetical protein
MSSYLRDLVRSVLREDKAGTSFGFSVYGGEGGNLEATGEDAAPGAEDEQIPLASAKDEEEWRKRVVDFAMRYKNVPYVWGGSTPQGFDCSGFAWYVLKNSGLVPNLKRERSGEQMLLGKAISRGQLKRGDLVGFKNNKDEPSHIGFYLEGNMYLSALGGDASTTLENPKYFKDKSRARVMEYDFTRDNRTQYYASLSNLIAKRLKEDESKSMVASAENDQQKKGEEKKAG